VIPDGRPVFPSEPDEATLREVIETLAPIARRPGSEGEHQAAEWIAARLTAAGCPAEVQAEQFLDGYARPLSRLSATGALAGLAALSSRRSLARGVACATSLGVAAALADDVSNGPRLARRIASTRKTTWNVVGTCGDTDAPRTLVVLAHHDAAATGTIFDDRALQWFGEHFPGLLERRDTSLPVWWLILAGPLLVGLGAASRRRAVAAAGTAAAALGVVALEDIARSPVVPGANDNLSAVAALVALAERIAAKPVPGLRVMLVSCGAEEVLQGGIYGFARRHFAALDRQYTWVLNLEVVGSPKLILLEGEGAVVMEDYHDRGFRDLVVRAAEQAGAPVQRGFRARTSTDAVIPSRAGYPTATLVSIDRYKALSNYHNLSDTPANVDYRTVRQAVTVVEAVAREVAANAWIGGV
jgi:acetylornithine deacetylase/succinyl-diaminopimelate desuccinylase-like protein